MTVNPTRILVKNSSREVYLTPGVLVDFDSKWPWPGLICSSFHRLARANICCKSLFSLASPQLKSPLIMGRRPIILPPPAAYIWRCAPYYCRRGRLFLAPAAQVSSAAAGGVKLYVGPPAQHIAYCNVWAGGPYITEIHDYWSPEATNNHDVSKARRPLKHERKPEASVCLRSKHDRAGGPEKVKK